MIGSFFRLCIAFICGAASSANWCALYSSPGLMMSNMWCGMFCISCSVILPVVASRWRYICRESADMTSPLYRFARSTAKSLLPLAVVPTMTRSGL